MRYSDYYDKTVARLKSHKRFNVCVLKHQVLLETNNPQEAVIALTRFPKAKLRHNSGWIIMTHKEMKEITWGFKPPKVEKSPNDPFAEVWECNPLISLLTPAEEVIHRVTEYYKRASSGIEGPHLQESSHG